MARPETDVINGAETCVRVGACTRSQRGDATRYDKYLVIALGLVRAANIAHRAMRVRQARAPDAT